MTSPHDHGKSKHAVLIGGGHAHALVLKSWGMNPVADTQLTVINPGKTAPYSGMLPGFVAGHYTRDALDIDLEQLARFAGARLVVGHATGIDLARKSIRISGQPDVGYDVTSIDIGITSDMPVLPGFAAHAIPAKPLGSFAAKWHAFRDSDGYAHIAVIGGGVAGAELIMAMSHALQTRGRMGSATLIDSAEALSAIPPKAAKIVRQKMTDLGVTVIENTGISEVCADDILLSDGQSIRSDFTTGAAGARPYEWVQDTGLALTGGFIDVDEFLRTSDKAVFATGDCAHLVASPRPKAGVYAVRQAPVLLQNLRAALTDDALHPYKAQKDYLKLISLGGKSAMGEKFGLPFAGSLIWKWKNHIDQSFMAQFRDLPPASSTD
ncbi:FAD-dependent oxidoreductase [Epibacterium ulvae]|uniref:FAD-dependent oxidoreductase n=1 Tax=Epibacterium ulvae TaxID=1156985 RepID=UPI001BFC673C|nr:FAD-dependent oxidoreductase [Epibacterium ulvae]